VELLEQQPGQLSILLRDLIFNELSQQQLRGLNNLPGLGILTQHWPERTAAFLADISVEWLLKREDYLRALRSLLHNLRQDLPLTTFCSLLLQATLREDKEQIIRDFEFKDRLMASLMDLTTLCIFLAISPSVCKSASLVTDGDFREPKLLKEYQKQAAAMQTESVKWLYEAVPLLFRPNSAQYVHCLHKVLFMEDIEQYDKKDGWPNEVDCSILLRLSSEIPVSDDTRLTIMRIGQSNDHPLSVEGTLKLFEQLESRYAAALVTKVEATLKETE
jgi:integrator complex subunit 1